MSGDVMVAFTGDNVILVFFFVAVACVAGEVVSTLS
jgi:hypothetical protein